MAILRDLCLNVAYRLPSELSPRHNSQQHGGRFDYQYVSGLSNA